MLLRLTIQNVLCFKNEVTFSMIASGDESHFAHIKKSQNDRKAAVLKASAIYGANGHGKTKFVDAVKYFKDLVCEGAQPETEIDVYPFALDPSMADAGSRYVIEFRVEENDYEYGIDFDANRVREEWLFYSGSSNREKRLFVRETALDGSCKMKYGAELLKAKSPSKKHNMETYLDVLSEGMSANQPFLKEAATRGVTLLAPAFDWFRYVLTPVSAESFYAPLHSRLQKEKSFNNALSQFLVNADVGIDHLSIQASDITEAHLSEFPDELVEQIKSMKDHDRVSFGNEDGSLLVFSKDDGKTTMSVLETVRKNTLGNPVKFSLEDESSGTRRLVDLFPMISNIGQKPRVFIVDELDRKLHPLLARNLLSEFLSVSQNQLIYTTHNTHLLDLALLRRDEIWFIQKKQDGSSEMYSLAEMKIRSDLDVRKGYLNGRFGAIPFLGNLEDLGWSEADVGEVGAGEQP